MKYKLLLVKAVFLWFSNLVLAQQYPLFSESPGQFSLYNPAALDWIEQEHPGAFLSLFYRHQWFELPGAPHTGGLNFTHRYNRWHWGTQLVYDQMGAFQNIQFGGRGAINLMRGEQQLAVGINIHLSQASVNLEDKTLYLDDNTVLEFQTPEGGLSAGSGLFYKNKYLFLGGSYQKNFRFSNKRTTENNLYEHRWYLIGGACLQNVHWLSASWLKVGIFPAIWQVSYRYHAPIIDFYGGLTSTLTKTFAGAYSTIGIMSGFKNLAKHKFSNYSADLNLELAVSMPFVSYLERTNLVFDIKFIYRIDKEDIKIE
ncbi:MAG: type IX secretion system membrane protein PorP/SprF [Saprospiraceae bacterium]|nr:type IX secretion system membrane protein PorP/SprF [Saprospiraceae bacterium]